MATMPSLVTTRRALMAFILVMGSTTEVEAGVTMRPDILVMGSTTEVQAGVMMRPDIEYLQLELNDTLRNLVEQPPSRRRCSPESEDATAARRSSAECNLLYRSVPYKGECHGLLKRGPCDVNHWIVLDKKTGRPTCQSQVCPDHQVQVTGKCTRLGKAASNRHCPETVQLIINEYGEAECDCPMGRVYHSPSGKCYDPYEKGPCEDGNVLQVIEKDGKVFADCVRSLCSTSGQVPMTSNCELAKFSETSQGDGSYKCYGLSSRGPCSTGFLVLDRTMLDVVCAFNHPYGVFDFLTGNPACMPGSMRDSMRDCRMLISQSVPEAVLKAIPTVEPGVYGDGKVCPVDHVFLGGTCYHIQSGH